VTGVAVVGTGFGARIHVPALRAAGFDVVALVGQDAEKTARRAARLEIPNACSSLEQALEIPDVDAVTIATPPDTHAALAIAAAGAGRHVICEKPFALDCVEAEAMLDAATRAGIVALVGHEFRWAEDRVTLARAVAAGAVGDPRQFSLISYAPVAADPDTPVPSWWFDRSRGGGWLGASGSHLVDQVRVTLGEFASVSASLPTVSNRPHGAEDSFVVRVTLVNGVEGVLQQTAAAWMPRGAGMNVIAGTDGTLEATNGEVYCSDRTGRRVLPVPDDARLPATTNPSDDPRHRYTHLELGPYTKLCEAFRARIESKEPMTQVPIPTFADGVASIHVLDTVRRSAAAGGILVRPDAGALGS
jgi:predicted dehydrogenase